MSDNVAQKYAEVVDAIRLHEENLATLRTKKALLEELGAGGVAQPTPNGQSPVASPGVAPVGSLPRGKKRTPKGALTAAILQALASGKPMTNPQIREALAKQGYTHPLKSLQMSKTLGRLKEAKKVRMIERGDSYEYTAVKK